ncbi:helix-turn-helix transcriptional regulator [Mycobacteroides abscessus]|uniref:helix-turn-helix transcriptional regulator n=1 Tax=Mycobacteroides abscessus TaxID=36809 RepID=UPI00092C996C|nr:hypothetical protein [Mycobacteroides abscessus]QSM04886.1 antitoxin [Mycobacterium phage prophi91-4]MDO3335134.1 hypothetical protein [Mycobacteroides abscessus subsp. bolletii]SIB01212.1 Uncharacterised protein [Mycobacteroides abscessus subsp. bolletii]SII69862.1 Uncharacterised protein [Mycobacteroides abscessus subsp. bolletii]SKS57121.1 Uncharacterised protein [Mycobacteroides abscessus subsp. bolletii]
MNTDWTVVATFDRDIDRETMELFEDKFEEFDGLVSRIPDRGQFQVSLHANGPMVHVFENLADYLANAIDGEPISLEILTDAEQARRADEPTMPELMSAVDVAEELGVSRQRVHTLRTNPEFPAPLAELGGGAVWDARAIRAFNERWDRKPGRPRGRSEEVSIAGTSGVYVVRNRTTAPVRIEATGKVRKARGQTAYGPIKSGSGVRHPKGNDVHNKG